MYRKVLSGLTYGLAGLVGLFGFVYPFMAAYIEQSQAAISSSAETSGTGQESLLTMILIVISLVVLLVEVHGQAVNAKKIATLGVLIAAASVLRLLETAIPGPGGFSPIFVPIILAGYVYGARFGLLMGILSLLVSALITAGVGPWLPYQMYVAGWVGLTAGWLPHPQQPRTQILMLAIFAFLWGLLFGALLNLYFWPYLAVAEGLAWQNLEELSQVLSRYGIFYLTTSLAWDLVRGFGNALLVLVLGVPALKALTRFKDRLQFELA